MVTTKTIYKCDICGSEVDNASKLTTLKIPCRVYDCEGRSTITSFQDADMCPECKEKYEAAVFNHFGTLYDTMGSLSFESAVDRAKG
jgi:DNA-directed RNA polymerase subunit RPC12/RpoP